MLISRISPFSGIEHTLDIPVDAVQMAEFNSLNRRMIQDIFPNLAPELREFIKTGITPSEWDDAFGPE